MRKVCIRVDRRFGERLRVLLVEQELLDPIFPILHEDEQLLFPLRTDITDDQLAELQQRTMTLTLVERDLEPLQRKPKDLITALDACIPTHLLATLPHSLDIIGDIAIVALTDALHPYTSEIGEAIMVVNPKVTTVYAKTGGVTGTHRIRPLQLIAGKARTQTVHVEYGIRLAVDVAKTYFSPRLSTEHDRVTALIQPGERILDMFTGVGPFAVLAANRHPVTVYAIDINEHAIRCLQQSLELNRLLGQVIPLVGDCRHIVAEKLRRSVDRIIMNLPHKAVEYLDVAAAALKRTGGVVHFYAVTSEQNPLDEISTRVVTQMARYGWHTRIVHTHEIRPTAPHEFQVVLDLQLTETDAKMTT